MIPELVRTLKLEDVHEPEYYLVECARRDQALTVADYFDEANDGDIEFIKNILPAKFPVRVGTLSNGVFAIYIGNASSILSQHHDTIEFKNWIVIRGEDKTDIEELYKKLGMET